MLLGCCGMAWDWTTWQGSPRSLPTTPDIRTTSFSTSCRTQTAIPSAPAWAGSVIRRVSVPSARVCLRSCRKLGRMRPLPILLVVLTVALPAADPVYESARRKLELIGERQAAPGSVIVFTPEEVNTWARIRVPEIIPEGIRSPRVTLGTDTGTGYALVDFVKLRRANGETTNFLLKKLIEGERPVKATVRMQSGGGRATVYLTRVEVSNVVADGTILDFLINTFFLPLYPDAKINEPFDLG